MMVMSINTVAMLFCNGTNASLVLALFLTSYLSLCSGILTKNIRIVREDNLTYPEITIPQGKIQGVYMVTRYNRTISGFIGIPYAQPPVGDLRFRAPVPVEAWEGTLKADNDSEQCPQLGDEGEVVGVEDCLYLNAFTPQLPTSENATLLPVMMYIIGGAFKSSNNSVERFTPDFLLDKDVVLVIPNFRLGVLGYLSTGDEVSPGNYGLKDIVQSLKWVQENIEYFGGDPNQVILSGGSSGAMSTHLLALSPLTDGLIHKYTTQSGTALSSNVNQRIDVPVNRAFKLGEHLGCPTNTSTSLVNCLRGLSVTEIVDTISIYYEWKAHPFVAWLPTVEPDIEGALLTDTPSNLFAAGKIRDLPYISLVTRDEGLVLTIDFYEDPDLFEDFLTDIDIALPYLLGYQYVVDDVAAYTTALKSFYLNDLTANRTLLLANLTDLVSDYLFNYPAIDVINQHLVLANSPQYFCCFSYSGVFSHNYLFSGGNPNYTGVAHGDEMFYLFGHQIDRFGPADAEFSESDYVMVETMVQLWTSFAINGTPFLEDSNGITTWEPYSTLNNYLRIGNGSDTAIEMMYDLHPERMQFWENLSKATTAVSGESRYTLHVLSALLCLCLILHTLRV